MLRPMEDAPRGGCTHVIIQTKWGQNWLACFDGRREQWRYGHGPNDLVPDSFLAGWMPYHGIEVWPYKQDVA